MNSNILPLYLIKIIYEFYDVRNYYFENWLDGNDFEWMKTEWLTRAGNGLWILMITK